MDYKALKKLANACRQAGIKSFKNSEVEFTLTDEGPISNYKRRTIKKTSELKEESTKELLNHDSLTEEQLLFYSVLDPSIEESTQ